MYLKSIEVYGFKSFANKILFKFNNGITCIVGPNGSGKSNVGDAVRWVLGEQSAKQLRGAKMEDVIFSGTELRKPHGSAYVAITLDNSDHCLPVDYNEVTIARRVYRSGESEYLINGVVSRLKDVQRMFFDTGIGKEGYSIIGQGQIEKILSGKPEERRELFDEAAGIVKYKKNKVATEKSLESERQNLSRVSDILKELEKQVGPLREQSETAKKFLVFKDELKKLDVNAFLLDVDNTGGQLKEYEEKLNIVNDDSKRLVDEFETAKEEYEKLEEELQSLGQKIDETRNEIHEKKLNNERMDGESNVINQQIISVEQSGSHLTEQIDRINNEIIKSKEELNQLYTKKTDLDDKLDSADDVVESAQKVSDEISHNIAELESNIEHSKAEIIEYMNEGGMLKAKVGRYDTMLENINFRKTQLNQRLLQNKSDELREKESLEKSSSELINIDELIAIDFDYLTKCEEELKSNIERNNSNKIKITEISQKIVSLKSKKEALRNLTERYDGYGNSIKRIMEQRSNNPKIIGVVADIISVNKMYETAIETALGGSIQNIVTEDENTAKAMIKYLKDNKYGRATFLPISSMTNKNTIKQEVLNEIGVVGLASKLVDVNTKYSSVINNLLGRIVVVNNIDNAVSLARKYNQTLRIVTTEGELINPGGSMTGGAFKNSSNLLGRKREIDEISEEVNLLNNELEGYSNLEVELKQRRDQLKKDIEIKSAILQESYIQKNTLTLNIDQNNNKLKEFEEVFVHIQRENNELATQIKEINLNKEQIFNSNKEQENAISDLEKHIEGFEKLIVKEKNNLSEANNRVSKLMLDFNTIKQQNDFIVENIKRIKSTQNSFKEELASYELKISIGSEEISQLNEKIANVKVVIDENNRIIVIKEQRLQEFIAYKNEISISHKEFFDKREQLSEQINGLDKSAYKINTSIEKLAEQRENLNDYMWDEYELTYNTAMELKNTQFDDISSLKREISAVKTKIKQLGDVNVNAINDYKEVSERYEFLKSQHDDIVKAEENLKNIIADLDRAMKEQFAEKFKEIRIMFASVFKELFGGGKADLELVDDDNILETGIKINAQPPGKKLQNMMQLSGGEKALTAISLLFAIQRLKPSPFCLLDEIEAALDDSNVRRFAKYLNRLTKDTQFIVITHRKGTMEAADVLYGITMQEKGISTLVSVNMIEDDLK